MATENKETVFDVRKPLALKPKVEVPKVPNGVRPMIQFVPGKQDITESRLKDVREEMTFTRAKKTIRRSGWYFTEPYAPCGSAISVIRLIKEVFGA